jgi:hypothetical protein
MQAGHGRVNVSGIGYSFRIAHDHRVQDLLTGDQWLIHRPTKQTTAVAAHAAFRRQKSPTPEDRIAFYRMGSKHIEDGVLRDRSLDHHP